jgi:DMSO/TMAO reductase YedYZ molybdopterin-dependent catalytic subunit
MEQGARPLERARLEPATFFRRIPLLPHQMRERFTPTRDIIVLCHLGVPRLDREAWSLTIDGLVARALHLRFADLAGYPKHTVSSFHECAGSPLQPFEPTRRICNVRWSGARLADVLRDCGPTAEARYLWSYGADYGSFGDMEHPAYVKDLPLERVPSDVLIAYELNDAPLPPEHGAPARLVVPGFYGTNSVKWLTQMTLTDRRAGGAFTTRWYNDPMVDADGRHSGQTTPVWSVAPESVIVSPAPGETLARGTPVEIWGWAWADGGVDRVEVSMDGGASWQAAPVEAREDRTWQRFGASWRFTDSGPVTLCARAASAGVIQPPGGRRNAIHRVEVVVA